ncbi:MAG: type IV pilus modification protein PilV [Chromatocurvus sp.]
MRRSGGYSFVELLLALLVFSLGAMAVAAMQLVAVQTTRSASESAAALLLAEDLAQRLLANPGAIGSYQRVLGGDVARAPGAAVSCLDGPRCAPDAWARRGVAAWLELREQRELDAARACVSRQLNTLQVSVSWDSRFAAASPGASCFAAGESDNRRAVTLRAPLVTSP